jgi:branched-chain amino acid transport system substrate-binding protein
VHLEDARATNVPLLEKILAKQGGQLVVTAGVDRKGPSLNDAAVRTLEAAKPEMLIILANNAPLTTLLRDYAPRTLVLPKMVISFLDREKLIADLGKDAAGVGFSVVVPEYTREKYWVVREFLANARELKVAVTPVSLEGFITGLALVEGLKQSRGESRNAFIDGMGRVGALDLGYTNLRYTRSERSGSRFVDLSLASRSAGIV